MKKIILFYLMLLVGIGSTFAQSELTYGEADLLYDFTSCPPGDPDGAQLQVNPQSQIVVSWDINNCNSGLNFNFQNFTIEETSGNYTFDPNLSQYCWASVGTANMTPNCDLINTSDGNLEQLQFLQETFDTDQGMIDATINLYLLYTEISTNIPYPCFVTLTIPAIDFDCPCEDIESVEILSHWMDCGHDDCSGVLTCDFQFELDIAGDYDPALLEVQWFQDGDLFDITHGNEGAELLDCSGCGIVTAEVRYANNCLFIPDPVGAGCDGLATCDGEPGDRVLISSQLESCEVDNLSGEVVCTYSLSISPNIGLMNTPVNIDGAVWTIDGVEYTGTSVTVTIPQGSADVTVKAFGQAAGVDCEFERSLSLLCNGDVCGNPCSFADGLELIVESMECGPPGEGCTFEFGLSDPGIANYIAQIDWFWAIFSPPGSYASGIGPIVNVPSRARVTMYATITFTTGCIRTYELDEICDDFTCEPCEPEVTLATVSENLGFCEYLFEVDGCDYIYLIKDGVVPTFNLSICGSEGCIADIQGGGYTGSFSFPFALHCNYSVNVAFELYYDGVLVTDFYSSATCPGNMYCGHARPEEQLNEERSAHAEDFSKLLVFPNPTDGVLHIDRAALQHTEAANLRLYGFDGSLVLEQKLSVGQTNGQIDIRHLPDGIYFVKIEEKEGKAYQQKIILKK